MDLFRTSAIALAGDGTAVGDELVIYPEDESPQRTAVIPPSTYRMWPLT
jgi:hypothetical protein